MKNITFLLVTFAAINLFWLDALAQGSCCAGGASSNYTLLPQQNKNTLALRYSFGNYLSETHIVSPEHIGHHHNSSEAVAVKEQLHMVEVFGRFNLASRLQLSVFLPVNFIHQQEPATKTIAGLGDMTFLLQYSFLKPVFCGNPRAKHQLRGGLGTKLPSGNFGERGKVFSTNLQAGSGSIDFLANLLYTFRYRQFGFNSGVAYKCNTTNPQGYYFGNKEQASLQFFYVIAARQWQVMPSAGFTYEHHEANRYQKETLNGTQGHFLGATVGVDVYYKRIAFSAAVIPAFLNELSGTAYSRGKLGAEAGVFYNFPTNKHGE